MHSKSFQNGLYMKFEGEGKMLCTVSEITRWIRRLDWAAGDASVDRTRRWYVHGTIGLVVETRVFSSFVMIDVYVLVVVS